MNSMGSAPVAQDRASHRHAAREAAFYRKVTTAPTQVAHYSELFGDDYFYHQVLYNAPLVNEAVMEILSNDPTGPAFLKSELTGLCGAFIVSTDITRERDSKVIVPIRTFEVWDEDTRPRRVDITATLEAHRIDHPERHIMRDADGRECHYHALKVSFQTPMSRAEMPRWLGLAVNVNVSCDAYREIRYTEEIMNKFGLLWPESDYDARDANVLGEP